MIRKFKTEDTKQVMQIWLEGNIEAHDFIPEDYWISQYPLVQEQMLQADIYIYEQDKKILGFAGMTDHYLAGIFVDKKSRSKGIGKSLLDYIKKIYSEFSLNVYQQNQRAVDFYLREGFSIVSEDYDATVTEYTMLWKSKKTESS